ncbi:hypothetical protein [Homoserinimonas sp. A520]
MQLGLNSIIRHYVLTTTNLPKVSGELQEFLGSAQGEVGGEFTLSVGFITELQRIGDSTLEITQAVWAEHRYNEMLAPKGDLAQMIVLQTGDGLALRDRALAKGMTLTKDKEFRGDPVVQFDFEVYGTRFETYGKSDGLWGRDMSAVPESAVKQVLGVEVAVADPEQVVSDLAEVFLTERDGTTIFFDAKWVKFVPANGGWEGLTTFHLEAVDPGRTGESKVICGTEFRFV